MRADADRVRDGGWPGYQRLTGDVRAVHVDWAVLAHNGAGRRVVPAAEAVPRRLALGGRCDVDPGGGCRDAGGGGL